MNAGTNARERYLWQGVCYFICYLFVYSLVCHRGGLHWDELFDTLGAANGTYVAAGRWGLSLYRYVFGLGYMPWISGIVAGVYIATALVIQTKMLGVSSVCGRFVYGAMYMGCIQWAFQLQYSHQSDAVAVALLCMTVAGFLLMQGKLRFQLLSMPLIIYACAVYQTALLYLMVLWLLQMLVERSRGVFVCGKHVRFLVFVFIAGLLYLLSSAVSKNLPVVSDAELSYMNAVQQRMTQWPEILAQTSLADRFSLWGMYVFCLVKRIVKNLLGATYSGQWVFLSAVIPLAGLIWGCLRKKKDYVSVVLLLLVWVMPFAMTLVLLSDQGARVSLAEPLSLAGLWGLYIKDWKDAGPKMRWVLILSVFVLLKSGYRCAAIAEDEKNIYCGRMANLQRLNDRIASLADSHNIKNPAVIYFGNVPTKAPNPYISRWNKRTDNRILIRLPDGRFPDELSMPVRKADFLEQQKYSDVVAEMSDWPATGCMRADGDVILVRFSD